MLCEGEIETKKLRTRNVIELKSGIDNSPDANKNEKTYIL